MDDLLPKTSQHNEEDLAVILNSIGDAVLATDIEGRITRLNPSAEKLLGWTQAEALGRPVGEVFHSINRETRRPAVIPVDKVLATGAIHGLANHTILILRDGTERPIAESAAPIRDKDGRILGAVMVFRDVSEEKKAERTLKQLASIVESSDDAITSKTLDGVITSWNPGAERLFGYTAEEIIGTPMARLFPPDRLDEEAQILARVKNGERVQIETVHVTKDGLQLSVSATISPIKDGDGNVIGASKSVRDITKRKQMEEALGVSEGLMRSVINSMHANIAVLDRHGTIIAINKDWETFALKNGADATLQRVSIGANYLEVCERATRDIGEEAQKILNGLRSVLSHSADAFAYEYACHSPTEQRWFMLNASPLSGCVANRRG